MAEMRITLDDELHQRFKILCVKRHMSMVSVVRDLIEKWVDVREVTERRPVPRPDIADGETKPYDPEGIAVVDDLGIHRKKEDGNK